MTAGDALTFMQGWVTILAVGLTIAAAYMVVLAVLIVRERRRNQRRVSEARETINPPTTDHRSNP